MTAANDTTTTANLGRGGSVYDETALLNADGTTTARRPRVVLGGEAGRAVLVEPVRAADGGYALPVALDARLLDALTRIALATEENNVLLRALLAPSGE